MSETPRPADIDQSGPPEEITVLAIGMLMVQRRCSRVEAASALACIAARLGRPVTEVAQRLVHRYDGATSRPRAARRPAGS